MGSREGKELKRVFFAVNSNEEISMKKTLLTCTAILALLAIASSAGAITCTVDQRPAATLLIPYFQATFNADGTPCAVAPCPGGVTPSDTLVTIGNASSAPMLVHVVVWNARSEIALDFNLALTGFDIQSWGMASLLSGNIPNTPVNINHVPQVKDTHQVRDTGSVCEDNSTIVYPAAGGYLRVIPTLPPDPSVDFQATTAYATPAFGTVFRQEVLDVLDSTTDSRICLGGTDGILANPIVGYVTIDMVNYCTLTNQDDPHYFTNDVLGFENNLWGDYIFVNSAGVSTMGFPAVAIEATSLIDAGLGAPGSLSDDTAAPTNPASTTGPGKRTFYRRYVTLADTIPCVNPIPAPQNAWDCGFGDQREPLGLKWAARWFDTTPVTSFFNVWRGSSGSAVLFSGGRDQLIRPTNSSGVFLCTAVEPVPSLTFYDEDENTVTSTCPISPCPPQEQFNFPLETQRRSITDFAHPAWQAGWVSMEFYNPTAPIAGTLDQAYVTYDFRGGAAFISAGAQGSQLDPTNCQPLLVPCATAGGPPNCYGPNPVLPGVTTTTPIIPLIVGSGP
jgi:hypothetical protein